MEQLEAPITRKILNRLRKDGGFWVKFHGNPLSRRGHPDITGCYKGRYVAMEVKRPGGLLTTLQAATLREIQRAGGIAGVVTSVEEALDLLARATPSKTGDSPKKESVTYRRTSRPEISLSSDDESV